MRKPKCVLAVAAIIWWITCPDAHADSTPVTPLRAAIAVHASKNADLLERSTRAAQIGGRSCGARVCAGAAIGAGFGAVFGALAVGSNGNRAGGAALGAVIFGILGAGFGYKACGP